MVSRRFFVVTCALAMGCDPLDGGIVTTPDAEPASNPSKDGGPGPLDAASPEDAGLDALAPKDAGDASAFSCAPVTGAFDKTDWFAQGSAQLVPAAVPPFAKLTSNGSQAGVVYWKEVPLPVTFTSKVDFRFAEASGTSGLTFIVGKWGTANPPTPTAGASGGSLAFCGLRGTFGAGYAVFIDAFDEQTAPETAIGELRIAKLPIGDCTTNGPRLAVSRPTGLSAALRDTKTHTLLVKYTDKGDGNATVEAAVDALTPLVYSGARQLVTSDPTYFGVGASSYGQGGTAVNDTVSLFRVEDCTPRDR